MKPIGYFVTDACEDHEQVLGLRHDDKTPPGGVLDWTKGPRTLFKARADALAAITRTEHYRLAFGLTKGGDALPEKKFCRVIPVVEGK